MCSLDLHGPDEPGLPPSPLPIKMRTTLLFPSESLVHASKETLAKQRSSKTHHRTIRLACSLYYMDLSTPSLPYHSSRLISLFPFLHPMQSMKHMHDKNRKRRDITRLSVFAKERALTPVPSKKKNRSKKRFCRKSIANVISPAKCNVPAHSGTLFCSSRPAPLPVVVERRQAPRMLMLKSIFAMIRNP